MMIAMTPSVNAQTRSGFIHPAPSLQRSAP